MNYFRKTEVFNSKLFIYIEKFLRVKFRWRKASISRRFLFVKVKKISSKLLEFSICGDDNIVWISINKINTSETKVWILHLGTAFWILKGQSGYWVLKLLKIVAT